MFLKLLSYLLVSSLIIYKIRKTMDEMIVIKYGYIYENLMIFNSFLYFYAKPKLTNISKGKSRT